MNLLIAFDATTKEGRVVSGVVMALDSPGIGIVCRRTGDEEWEAVHAIMASGHVSELPSCFVLSDEGIDALNMMASVIEANPEEGL